MDILQLLRDSSRVCIMNQRGVVHLKNKILMPIIILGVSLVITAELVSFIRDVNTVRANVIKLADAMIASTK